MSDPHPLELQQQALARLRQQARWGDDAVLDAPVAVDPWAAFVTARLDEVAEADWHVFDCNGMPAEDGQCCDAQRWLARDAAAKREILALHTDAHKCPGRADGEIRPFAWSGNHTCGHVLHLAAIWADHPDYAALPCA